MCLMYGVPLCLFGNIVLSVSIVIVNKLVYVKTGFPNVTLTLVHFIFTYIGLLLCEKARVFQVKHIHLLQILPLAISFCGFVVLTNLSLGFNTVGTYQILKTLTMPMIMIIQSVAYKRTFSWKIKFTLIPISLGVILNSAYDVKFNIPGTICALTGVVVTSFYQVWVGEKQKELQVNSMQLLYYQAPLSVLLLFICLPIIEPPWVENGLFKRSWSPEEIGLVVLSSFIAFLVNVSIYWIIGNTSAVTFFCLHCTSDMCFKKAYRMLNEKS